MTFDISPCGATGDLFYFYFFTFWLLFFCIDCFLWFTPANGGPIHYFSSLWFAQIPCLPVVCVSSVNNWGVLYCNKWSCSGTGRSCSVPYSACFCHTCCKWVSSCSLTTLIQTPHVQIYILSRSSFVLVFVYNNHCLFVVLKKAFVCGNFAHIFVLPR